jgi:hypothetical protein
MEDKVQRNYEDKGITYDDVLAWLEKQGEQKPYTFNAIPRLLEMIKPTDKAKAYCQKLIDSLEEEGYKKDAKIVDGFLKQWNGEEVPMATMDEQNPVWSEEDEKMLNNIINLIHGGAHYAYEKEIEWLKGIKDKCIPQTKQTTMIATLNNGIK